MDSIKNIDFTKKMRNEMSPITNEETTKKLIELLKEYRTALISEAVTGKIKVFEDEEI